MNDIQIRVVKGAGRPRYNPDDKRIRVSYTVETKINDQIRDWFLQAKASNPNTTQGDTIKDMVETLKAINFNPTKK